MRRPILVAAISSALAALTLCGSTWRITSHHQNSIEVSRRFAEAYRFYQAGEFARAEAAYASAATQSEREGSPLQTANSWNNAGATALLRMNFRQALPYFQRARKIAETHSLTSSLLVSLINLSDLYLGMGQPDQAYKLAAAGNALPISSKDTENASKLQFHLAIALARLHRFPEARRVWSAAIRGIADSPDRESLARMLGNFGDASLDAGDLEGAEASLSEALRIVRTHGIKASANILRALARLRFRQGDLRSAQNLFDAALSSGERLPTEWQIRADRGELLLATGDLRGALKDFEMARAEVRQMRADIVPADQDRMALSKGLNRVPAGIVEAGNRLFQKSGDRRVLKATFDAAEQDRLWTLRATLPTQNDWRSHLPAMYWDRMAVFQSVQRSLLASPTPALAARSSALSAELGAMEAAAGSATYSRPDSEESALEHVQGLIEEGTALLSFHLTPASGWLWIVDRHHVSLHAIPGGAELKPLIEKYVRSVRGGEESQSAGRALYSALFSSVPTRIGQQTHWLVEPDGVLYDLPIGALPDHESEALGLRHVLQVIPGALMLEPLQQNPSRSLVGVGDPIYNKADSRFAGSSVQPSIQLPRLGSTAQELKLASEAWGSEYTRILAGPSATVQNVTSELSRKPAIIHFATHVVSKPDSAGAGMIALGLDDTGELGLLGPDQIVAQSLPGSLVILNGCHSGAGEALPGEGLTGLTRAWMGAGASAVVATRWDIPDEGGAALIVEFYKALRSHPQGGAAGALRQAQLAVSRGNGPAHSPSVWAAYFVMGREI